MTAALDKTIDLRHYLRIPMRRKGVLVLATVAVVCGALIGLSFVPKQYESTATLLIQEHQPLIQPLDQVLGRGGSPQGSEADRAQLSKVIGRVRSKPFLQAVTLKLKMNLDPRIRAEAEKRRKSHPEISVDDMAMLIVVQSLRSRISFGSAGPGIYQITVGDYDPTQAQLLATWVSELFRTETKSKAMEEFQAIRDFGEERLQLLQEQLRQSEKALEDYKGSIIQTAEHSKVGKDNLSLAEFLYRRTQDETKTAETRMASIARSDSTGGILQQAGPRLLADPEVGKLSDQLGEALARAVDDRLDVGPSAKEGSADEHPVWPPQGGNFAELRQHLNQRLENRARSLYPHSSDNAIRTISNHTFYQVDARTEAKAGQYLSDAIAAYRRQTMGQPADELELQRRENEVAKNQQMLTLFRDQVWASELRQAMERMSLGLTVEILDPANLPLAPSRPNKAKILMSACVFGPLLGALFAFLAETMDSTLRSLADIQRLAPEPILGTAPLLSKLRSRRRGLRGHWIPAAVTGVLLLTAVFFIARRTALLDQMVTGKSIQTVDPGEVGVQGDPKP